ncbi:DUF3228 domain-containing protein [Chloropicon primus]|uniref:DUF3228 domain-containing protein n=1 Tax=Chloropicon primus TaxID=1764295 RepID=A0A5B8MEQ7_9CHLO|nr:DUF3228 domain-containing protein [Chloropicon primus]UPQ97948.1 DUF3228 domain-containing protein [Chloropicon primus]|eukprot:QDZ18741.1 DUF3228 domain-containing protein [Chloropicon primus]
MPGAIRQAFRSLRGGGSLKGSCGARGTVRAMSTAASKYLTGKHFFLDPFAERQWDDPSYKGGRITKSKEEFTQRVNDHHEKVGGDLVDGYAPFCKHVFVPNFLELPVQAVPITDSNEKLVQSGYVRRTPKELPVLSRWISESSLETVPVAKMLDVILYSRKQIIAERVAQGDKEEDVDAELPQVDWGIISIKAQDEDHEIPMQPITMMRNALGKEEGGSGVPMDRDKYEASVKYWDSHATIQS